MSGKEPRGSRLLSLVLALSKRELGVTAAEIAKLVPAYTEGDEEARRKRFTRDKEDLKEFGFRLSTHTNGYGEEVYRLERGVSFEADLSATQRLLVRAAAGQWSEEAEPDFATRLMGAIQRPDNVPRSGLSASRAVAAFALATTREQPVRFTYAKPGAKPEVRVVEPWYLFLQEGNLYVRGFDRMREDTRTFRLSRVAPDGITILDEPFTSTPEIGSGLDLVAPVIAALEGEAPLIRGRSVAAEGTLPAGWDLLEGNPASLGEWLELCLSEIEHVVVLEPATLREAVDVRIEAMEEL